ncbi:hydroxylysine kinase-like isoform X2, partial [Dinothrombium tinctorium]
MDSEKTLLKPGVVIKPNCNELTAVDLVHRFYGFKVIELTEMNSYDDRNYLITVEERETNCNLIQYTLKITNSLESSVPNLIEAFNEMGIYLKQNGLTVPYPIPSKDGKLLVRVRLSEKSEAENAVRLLTFIPGKLIREVEYTKPLLYEAGKLLAKLTNALEKFENDALKNRNMIWSLNNVPRLRSFLFALKDESRKVLVSNLIKEFEIDVLSKTHSFKAGIIHGDFNEQNLIVDKVGNEFKPYGIIDFGDCHFAPLVFDLAILCTYIMLDCKTMDPTEAPAYVIAGYTSLRALTDEEFSIIPLCIKARLCQSLVLGAYTYSQDPSNEYILSSSKTGWTRLQNIIDINETMLLQLW